MRKILLSIMIIAYSISLMAQQISINQVSRDKYIICIDKKTEVLWNSNADSWDNPRKLVVNAGIDTVVLSAIHPIIKFNSKNIKPVYVSNREIKLQGGINFRDLGGYYTKDGHQVKWGKIYRSADISKLTDDDLQVLKELKLKIICDLRGDYESKQAPDRIPENTGYFLLSAGSENVGKESFVKGLTNIKSADSTMTLFYSRTDHLKAKYKPMFDELLKLNVNEALLFHCTAGKDRTGVGAALILYALGVDEATIYKDYEATNIYRKELNEKTVKMMVAQGLSEEVARFMMSANPKFLKATFDSIKKQYGSIDAFLENEMGLTSEKMNSFKNKLLYQF